MNLYEKIKGKVKKMTIEEKIISYLKKKSPYLHAKKVNMKDIEIEECVRL